MRDNEYSFSRRGPRYTETGEAVSAVLAGAVASTGMEFQATGQWFAVRATAGGEPELLEDLQKELEERKQKLVSMSSPGSIRSIEQE